ncbi:hypothetical protein DD238_002378 [Peronospora effusa]|uniref:SET domain-containing protein n=1 Tax=Peronospora effusa TaxID=542832 RepID=A0A3M6VIJ3_9STRA|nr:hypothetical protein DD238_002378 [Peronospora effusa]
MVVIVLDDSSDASSEVEMGRVSAFETPPASPAVSQGREQSIGYTNAVETALAMAAALETRESANSHSSTKRKEMKAISAPPLMSKKTNNLSTKQKIGRRRQQQDFERRQSASRSAIKYQDMGNNQKTVHRRKDGAKRRSRVRFNSSSGYSSSDSGSGSWRCHFGAAEQRRVRPIIERTKEKSSSFWRQKQRRRRATVDPATMVIHNEIVDLLSSSSSSFSDTSLVCHSSGSETPTKTSVKAGQKQLMLTDRVLKENQPLASRTSGQHAKLLLNGSKHSANKVLRGGKRKRLLPQMQSESTGEVKKRGLAPGILSAKKSDVKNVTNMGGRQPLDAGLQSTTLEQSAPVSVLSSGASMASALPSPASLPRQITSHETVAKPPFASHLASQAHEGKADVLRQIDCHTPVSASTALFKTVISTVSQPAPEVSVCSLASLSPSAVPRKMRRVLSRFNADRVSLDDLQAQERELAWIQSQRKQSQNRSRSLKRATRKSQTCRQGLCVDDCSDSKSVVGSKGGQNNEWQIATKAKPSHRVKRSRVDGFHTAMLHSTSYRGVFFDETPSNFVCGHKCSVPFEPNCDHSLAFYVVLSAALRSVAYQLLALLRLLFADETNTLISYCSILESFGKPTQCISSVFPSEAAKSQSDVTRSVNSLVTAYLPIIRLCYRRKVQAILSEARQKIFAYQAEVKSHRITGGDKRLTPHYLLRSYPEKRAVKHLKSVKHKFNSSFGGASFQVGRGDGLVRERTLSAFVQVNAVQEIRPLRRYTTSVGLRTNYRVEDDPILPYAARVRQHRTDGGSGGGELTKKHDLRIGHVADDEVAEYVLRLVVRRLGDSEQVFHALKSELNFTHAFTAYSELKKLHNSRVQASARLDHVKKLSRDGSRAADPNVTAIVKLMEQSSLLNASSAKKLRRRLQPPIGNFESNVVDNLVESTSASMKALGLRASDSYSKLVGVYTCSFCRMCYMYACHEHGGDHPLPTRRMEPTYPRVRLVPHIPLPDEAASLTVALDENVVNKIAGKVRLADTPVASNVQREQSVPKVQQDQGGLNDVIDMSEDATTADPSEYVDTSHISLVAPKMRSFLSTRSACGKLCRKNSNFTDDLHNRMTPAELGLIGKLREAMGDNSCLLAAVVGGNSSCIELHQFMQKERSSGESQKTEGLGRSWRRLRSWKQGQTLGGGNHELLRRTRDQRLQDRGTENHEYKPCMHEGLCDSTGCSCMKRDHMCEKACACSRDCPNRCVQRDIVRQCPLVTATIILSSRFLTVERKNGLKQCADFLLSVRRFEGCTCTPGECRTSLCQCYAALRECDPDVCVSCGSSEIVVAMALKTITKAKTCDNMNVIRGKHKRLSISFSDIHGYGMYAREAITAGEFVYEYAGAMVSQDEAERRGLIYDKTEMSFLFDLNEDAVLDALRYSNKSKFINHEKDTPNCTAKAVSVCGVHHITIWALRTITVGEELVFDYGYKRSVAPDWSRRQTSPKDTR